MQPAESGRGVEGVGGRARGARRRTAIVVGAVVGGLVITGGALYVAREVITSGPSASSSTDVVELADEPEELWSVELAGDDVSEFVAVDPYAYGDGVALVTSFDRYTWLETTGLGSPDWYPGYEEHYELGYAAGVEYSDALTDWESAFYADWDYAEPYPEESDYWPSGLTWDEADTTHLGLRHGFDDGANSYWREPQNRLEEPPAAPMESSLALVDANGRESVRLTLAAFAEQTGSEAAAAEDVRYSVIGTVEDAVVVAADSYADRVTTIAMLHADGTVGTSIDLAGHVGAVVDGGTLVVAHGHQPDVDIADTELTVEALPLQDLAAEPLWTEHVRGAGFASVCHLADGLVAVTYLGVMDGVHDHCAANGEGAVFSVADGSSPDFADTGEGTAYVAVGENFLRLDYDEDEDRGDREYALLDRDGEDLWEEPLVARSDEMLVPVGELLVLATYRDDGSSITRMDERTGDELWSGEVEDVWVLGGVRDALLVYTEGGRLEWLDPRSGEVVASERFRLDEDLPVIPLVAQSGSIAYLTDGEGELVGYRSDGEELWSVDLSGSQFVRVGVHIYAVSDTELVRLG